MSFDLRLFIETVLSPSIATSIILGLLVGAFYGYSIAGSALRPHFPMALWTVGLAWLVSTAILGAFGEAPFRFEVAIGRMILWTILCLAIPAGRWMRTSIDLRALRRRREKLEE